MGDSFARTQMRHTTGHDRTIPPIFIVPAAVLIARGQAVVPWRNQYWFPPRLTIRRGDVLSRERRWEGINRSEQMRLPKTFYRGTGKGSFEGEARRENQARPIPLKNGLCKISPGFDLPPPSREAGRRNHTPRANDSKGTSRMS
jgi:hypothetical protein